MVIDLDVRQRVFAICPACARDVEVVVTRRLDLITRRHLTPLGMRCLGSRQVVDLGCAYTINVIEPE